MCALVLKWLIDGYLMHMVTHVHVYGTVRMCQVKCTCEGAHNVLTVPADGYNSATTWYYDLQRFPADTCGLRQTDQQLTEKRPERRHIIVAILVCCIYFHD
jgi:hypothetical protein